MLLQKGLAAALVVDGLARLALLLVSLWAGRSLWFTWLGWFNASYLDTLTGVAAYLLLAVVPFVLARALARGGTWGGYVGIAVCVAALLLDLFLANFGRFGPRTLFLPLFGLLELHVQVGSAAILLSATACVLWI